MRSLLSRTPLVSSPTRSPVSSCAAATSAIGTAGLALLGLVVIGCGESVDSSSGRRAPSIPIPASSQADNGPTKADSGSDGLTTLTFNADFSLDQSGPVVAGQRLRVRYALERLPDCRGTQAGLPQWNITGHYAVDGEGDHRFEVTQVQGRDRVAQDAIIEVPRGSDLAFWFEVTNRWGCNAYDSDFGNNFHVAIETPADEAVLAFDADFNVNQSGRIVAGGTVRIQYALERLPDCRGTQGGYPQWNITGHYTIDGGDERTFELTEVSGDDRVAKDAVIAIFAGRDLAIWFQVTNRWGCSAYDSNRGGNYHFGIESP